MKDEKEKAEHYMLVDLARNDIGRVAEYGSVSVPEVHKNCFLFTCHAHYLGGYRPIEKRGSSCRCTDVCFPAWGL